MTDPVGCMRIAAICISIWNIIYAVIMIGVMGWQVQIVKNLSYQWDGRYIPDNAFIYSDFKSQFPGLYGLYTETPEKRRVNAMFAIVIICLVIAIIHLPVSIVTLWASIKRRPAFLWAYFTSAFALIVMSTAYAVLWWSGDVFTEQLVMSVAVFVMSLALSGPTFFVMVFFYIRLSGSLSSAKPARVVVETRPVVKREVVVYKDVPAWRTDWPERPPPELERKIRRKSRERIEREEMKLMREEDRMEKERRRLMRLQRIEEEQRRRERRTGTNPNVDYIVPQAGDSCFPWNVPVPRPVPIPIKPRKKSAAEVIENLYYEHYPEEMPKEVGALRRERR